MSSQWKEYKAMRSLVVSMCTLLLLLAGVCAVAADGERASGTLVNGAGQEVGTVQLEQTAGGVAIAVTASELTPGPHGIHLHAVGQCAGPTFTSAGAHANPTGKKHGLRNPEGPHAGDLPNLVADASGRATYRTVTAQVTLSPGSTSLFDADGAALVIHAQADDEVTDPSGNSGDRVACAVLESLPASLPRAGMGGLATDAGPLLVATAILILASLAVARRRSA
jgi:Cu-Zn family superoxide dismutase